MTTLHRTSTHSLVRFSLNSPDAQRLVAFYEKAFSARVETRERQDSGHFHQWPTRVEGGADRTVIHLGDSSLEILQFDHPGARYPENLPPFDSRFQHVAIVVTDMHLAMERLSRANGWIPISTAGPQVLPHNAGGVTAYKFRDPDGHPVEFLQFPQDHVPEYWQRSPASAIFSGIDHSAISVPQIDRSVLFYQSLGLEVSSRTLNQGQEQQRLDGVRDPHVDVVGLSPMRVSTPHVELLHYRSTVRPAIQPPAYNDIAATRMILAGHDNATNSRGRLVQDPDWHFLELLESPINP